MLATVIPGLESASLADVQAHLDRAAAADPPGSRRWTCRTSTPTCTGWGTTTAQRSRASPPGGTYAELNVPGDADSPVGTNDFAPHPALLEAALHPWWGAGRCGACRPPIPPA
ncbi:hypothetical protein Misp03_79250 [Microbispora sp. NBRC 16548]|nr:hypothetical protein Misp03_79250 [Microbispora sp. NBRC 16548]